MKWLEYFVFLKQNTSFPIVPVNAKIFQERSYQEHVASRAQQKVVEIHQFYKQQMANSSAELQGVCVRRLYIRHKVHLKAKSNSCC